MSATQAKSSLIHPTAILHANVALGEGSKVEPYVVLGNITGEPLEIGPGAIIRSGTRIYGGVTIGAGLRTGHNALIRGKVTVGDDFHIGSYSSVEGNVRIGNHVKVQGRCEIADSDIFDGVRLWVGCYVCDNIWPPDGRKEPPIIHANAKVFARVTVMPGSIIGEGSVVAAESMVTGIVPAGHLYKRDGRVVALREA